jgi:lipid II:glycine glycyltransferase (peptidoglycan interpeptide bridge formation enzyme)
MIAAGAPEELLGRMTADPAAWDIAIAENGGHLLQSWRWGAFKERFGWQAERVVVPCSTGIALAQILFRHRVGISLGYIPRGPVLPADATDAHTSLWAGIDRVARKRRALTIIVESDRGDLAAATSAPALKPGPDPIQPSRTVKVELGDDASLLAQMHQKTRYNVRLAQRRGVASRHADHSDEAVQTFYGLLQDTSSRNEFGIHSVEYYREFLRIFGDDAALIFADIEGRTAAGVIAASFGDEAIYMYGASSTKDRAHGAGFLLQYEAMRWARDRGCKRYDLWGIPAEDPPTTKLENGDRIAGTSGNDWRGLYEFKTRFGGQVISYPPPVQRLYRPLLATMAMRFANAGAGT